MFTLIYLSCTRVINTLNYNKTLAGTRVKTYSLPMGIKPHVTYAHTIP